MDFNWILNCTLFRLYPTWQSSFGNDSHEKYDSRACLARGGSSIDSCFPHCKAVIVCSPSVMIPARPSRERSPLGFAMKKVNFCTECMSSCQWSSALKFEAAQKVLSLVSSNSPNYKMESDQVFWGQDKVELTFLKIHIAPLKNSDYPLENIHPPSRHWTEKKQKWANVKRCMVFGAQERFG